MPPWTPSFLKGTETIGSRRVWKCQGPSPWSPGPGLAARGLGRVCGEGGWEPLAGRRARPVVQTSGSCGEAVPTELVSLVTGDGYVRHLQSWKGEGSGESSQTCCCCY